MIRNKYGRTIKKMKQIYILITLLLSLSNAYSQGIGRVEADVGIDNISLTYTTGHHCPPLTTQTIWTDDDSNQDL